MILPDALTELRTWVGRTGRASNPVLRAEWARILLPHDGQAWAQRYLEAKGAKVPTSTCALVAVRFFSLLGCTCSEHAKPYQPRMGSAVADVERIARRHGAWRTGASLGVYPAPGDVLCMRPENPHVSVVYGSRASDGAILSVDGGQVDNTYTRERHRTLFAPDGGAPYVVDLADGTATNVGRVSKLYARVNAGEILVTLENCK